MIYLILMTFLIWSNPFSFNAGTKKGDIETTVGIFFRINSSERLLAVTIPKTCSITLSLSHLRSHQITKLAYLPPTHLSKRQKKRDVMQIFLRNIICRFDWSIWYDAWGGGGVRIYTVGKCTWHLSLHKFLELKSFKKKRIKINSFLIVYWNMNMMATLFPVKQYKSLFVICTFCALWHRLFLKTYDENLILPTQSTSIPAGLSLLVYPIYPAT